MSTNVRDAQQRKMYRTGEEGEAISPPRRTAAVDARTGTPYSNGSEQSSDSGTPIDGTQATVYPMGTNVYVDLPRIAQFRAEFPFGPQAMKAGIGVSYLYLCCLAYCERTGTKTIPEVMIRTFADWSQVRMVPKEVAEAAVDAGLLARTDEGYHLRTALT